MAAVLTSTFVTLLAPVTLAGPAFSGLVVGVTDGDTIKVMRDGREAKVRLASIDCPERGQAFGRSARYATTALVLGKTVTVVTEGRDQYGRIVGEVLLPDGSSLNRALVRAGWAWEFRRYSKDRTLAEIEAEARAARRGLWADPHPVSPWAYRKQYRSR